MSDKPNEEAARELLENAADYDALAKSSHELADLWQQVGDHARRADLHGMLALAQKLIECTERTASLLELARVRTMHIKHVDRAYFDHCYERWQRDLLEAKAADWSAERLQHEIEQHEQHCDRGSECKTGDVLRELLAIREAH